MHLKTKFQLTHNNFTLKTNSNKTKCKKTTGHFHRRKKKQEQQHPTKRLATKEMKTESSSLPTKHKDTI